MSNPAFLLHRQFLVWNKPELPASQARNPEQDQWQTHRLMVRHLEAIDQLLNKLAERGMNVTVYRRTFPSWCAAVYAFPNGWGNPRSGALDLTALNHLETLAAWLDSEVPAVADGALDQLSEYVASIRKLLVEDGSLPPEFKGHLGQIIAHLEWCILNYSIAGDFEVRVAVERLMAGVAQAAAQSTMKDKWSTMMTTFVWPFAINIITAIPGQMLTQAALPN